MEEDVGRCESGDAPSNYLHKEAIKGTPRMGLKHWAAVPSIINAVSIMAAIDYRSGHVGLGATVDVELLLAEFRASPSRESGSGLRELSRSENEK